MSASGYFRFTSRLSIASILQRFWDLWPANSLEAEFIGDLVLLEIRFLAGPPAEVAEILRSVMARLREVTTDPSTIDYFAGLGANPGERPELNWSEELEPPVPADPEEIAVAQQPFEQMDPPYKVFRLNLTSYHHEISKRLWWTPGPDEESVKQEQQRRRSPSP